MITHVKFVSVPVLDQDRALAFYTGKMGFKLVSDQPFDDNQRWIELRIANSETRFVLFTPDGHAARIGDSFNGALACDNVEATYRQLSAKGVEFVGEPEQQPWGSFVIMKDSEGNRFVLSSRS
jgi:predicted enzyme related to lactoylglutathione lyase